ncbi:type II secretion system F family protein [Sphaerimonospora sp. CA-214678]|uniref:type II secretion system F family protein n=1 Tax=Sphaerimonospora sp. CA-214678 TaxID=3240029 RepID=UPI003D8EACBE
MTWVTLAAGGTMGLGLFLILLAVRPSPPELAASLARLQPGGGPVEIYSLRERLRRSVIGVLGSSWLGNRATAADLAIVGRSRETHLGRKALLMAAGLCGPAILWTYGWLLDVTFPAIFLWAASAVFGAVMFTAPELSLRVEAANARRQFRRALVCYLDLVALGRLAGRGPADALDSAARVGKGRTFKRLAAALDPAFRGTGSAWDELARLSQEIAVPELAEVAAIARMAGTEGASILDTLKAKAASLRESELAALLARAKSRTETMTVPMSLTIVGFMVLLGYPALARMTGGG